MVVFCFGCLVVGFLAYIGAVGQRVLLQAIGADITWPLLLLSLLIFGIFYSGALTAPGPAGCYTIERVRQVHSIDLTLWIAWSGFACLGLGAAIGKNDTLSQLAWFVFPLVIIFSVAALLGLAVGDPVLCRAT